MNRKMKVFIPILLVMILALSMLGANTASASPGATATLKFDASSRSLTVEIYSPVGISDAQIKLDIPTALTINSESTTGFMSNATYLASGTEHRWLILSSNGQTSGSVVLSLAIPENKAYLVKLLGVGLKDTGGRSVQIDTSFPASVSIHIVVLTTSVFPAGSGSVHPEGGTYEYGVSLNLEARPAEGYKFKDWSGTNNNFINPTTVTMYGSKAVVAYFVRQQYTLTTNVHESGSGSISLSPGGGTYDAGTWVTLKAEPSDPKKWKFSYWSGTDNNFVNPTTVTMDSDKDVTAYFTKVTYTLTTSVNPLYSGSISISLQQDSYDYGTLLSLEASRNVGYIFLYWSGDASGTLVTTTITMNSDKSVTAFFRKLAMPDIFEALDDYFENRSCSFLGGIVPTVNDIFSLLDEYFAY